MKKWLGLLLGSALQTLVFAGDAHAQKPTDAVTDEARVLAEKGAGLLAKKEWEKACAAYQAAWALKQHYSIAGDMAVCETELGRYRDAAEHLRYTVDAMSKEVGARAEERAAVQAALDKALGKIVELTVTVSEPGAELSIDGVKVGVNPLPKTLYLEPGKHTVRAHLEGFEDAEETWEGAAGSKKSVALTLEKASGATPTMPAWRTPAIVVGGGLGFGLLLGGVVTTVLANNAAGDADDTLAELRASGIQQPCGGAQKVVNCGYIADRNQDSDKWAHLAVPLFISGGVAVVGTTILALVTRPEESKSALQVRPLVGPDSGGIGLSGAF